MTSADLRLIAHELPQTERLPHRKLMFQGAHNFRDLGGYKNAQGQHVKWGCFYRSDRLSNLTDEDLKFLSRLGLRNIIDLRSKSERDGAPSRLPKNSNIEIKEVPVFEDGAFVDTLWSAIASGKLLGKDLHDIMVTSNRNFIRLHTKAFAQFIQIVANAQNTPLMFHCMAGKDRTGFGAALILTILGVSRDDVLKDYLETNTHLANNADVKYQDFKERIGSDASFENLRPILGVHEDYLNAAFETIEEDYGHFNDYLVKALNVTQSMTERMQENFLESL